MVNPAVAPGSSDDLKEMPCHAYSVLATRRRCCPTGWLGDLRRYTSAALFRCSIYLFKTRV